MKIKSWASCENALRSKLDLSSVLTKYNHNNLNNSNAVTNDSYEEEEHDEIIKEEEHDEDEHDEEYDEAECDEECDESHHAAITIIIIKT